MKVVHIGCDFGGVGSDVGSDVGSVGVGSVVGSVGVGSVVGCCMSELWPSARILVTIIIPDCCKSGAQREG